MSKIKVFVRHCFYSDNSAKKIRPENFSRDICYKNLKRTSGDLCDITYMLDTAHRNDSRHFIENFGETNIVENFGGNDAISFLNTINYIESLKLNDDDIIYFCEDDYFHVNGWPHIMMEVFNTLNPDYVTLYTHPDKYGMIPVYNNLLSKVFVTEHSYWRTVPNTTNTYACKYKTFISHINIHKKYCDLVEKWTKDSYKFSELMSIGCTLLEPMPAWSTHMELQYMSYVIDWKSLIEFEMNT